MSFSLSLCLSDNETVCRWIVTLPATDAVTPFTIAAVSSGTTITLSDVLFGDVWVCSGQSNMQFTVPQVNSLSLSLSISISPHSSDLLANT